MIKKAIFLKTIYICIDVFVTLCSYLFAYFLRINLFTKKFEIVPNLNKYLWVMLLIIPLWPFIFNIYNVYKSKSKKYFFITCIKLMLSNSTGITIIAAAFYFMGDNSFSRLFYGIFAIVNLVFLISLRILAKMKRKYYNNTKNNFKKVLVIGTRKIAKEFTNYIENHEGLMIEIVGYIKVGENKPYDGLTVLGELKDLKGILQNTVIDEAVFALPREFMGHIETCVEECVSMGITVNVVVNLYDLEISKTHIEKIGDLPVLTYHTVSLDEWQLFLKRLLDIGGSIIGLFVTFFIFLFVAPLIKIESKGPIMFKQKRVGKNGRIFTFYKFRSMCVDAECRKKDLLEKNEMDGVMFKIANDPRVTKIGKFIRKTSLDEFPQFMNVLKGQMSLVGTRPPTLDEIDKYDTAHYRRLSIKPGITGFWQVKGRNKIKDFDEIVKLDTDYIDDWSILLDLKILCQTVIAIFNRKGAS
jgi:exopolysaccharide biosynthesis polyprenyl glycosylphosphotransferase